MQSQENTSVNNMKIAIININSIKNKMDDIIKYFNKQKLDILLIQKNHLTNKDTKYQ
jgi:exonuclease III